MVGELDSQGNLIKTFIYASKSHVPDYFVDSNNNRFKLIVDQLGSVRFVVNATTGEMKEKMLHDEFGKVLIDTNPNFIPFGFAGGIYDTETKLVRFGARDYNSEIGRWTSKDPIRFDAKDTNIYGYVFQDPVNYIDPNGKEGSWIAAGICKITSGRCCKATASEAIKCATTDPDPVDPLPTSPKTPSNQCGGNSSGGSFGGIGL